MTRARDRVADLRARIRADGGAFAANDNIARYLAAGDLEAIETEARGAICQLLDALCIDQATDHNSKETGDRVARMFVREVFRGRYEQAPEVTSFPNVRELDELFTVGPIAVRSTCAHHLVPILGKCWIGVIPGPKLVGLSKYTRLAEWVLSRPQIQEEAAVQLADVLEQEVRPKALGVVIEASHLCTRWRGVRDQGSSFTTSVMRGLFRKDASARAELLSLIGRGA